MRWKLVALPAPFGPISAPVSFSCTEKLTSCTARKPPKRLLRPLMTNASAIVRSLRARRLAPDVALIEVGPEADQPGRPPQDDSHQDQAVDGELDAADPPAQPALQQRRCGFQQHSADDGPPERADPADNRDQRGFDRDVEAEGSRGVDEVDVLGVERAGERRQERNDT